MRKIIKKQKLAAVLLSIGLAAALSGCQTEAAKDSGTAAEASASQETVSDTAPDTEVASELEETKNAEPLPSKKDDTVSPAKRELAKKLRSQVKDTLQTTARLFFATPLSLAAAQGAACREPVETLVELTLSFDRRMRQKKQEKKLVDFSDIEHFALDILIKREGELLKPSAVALEYRQHFHEILIDEYQDSNLVQEYLLKAVSGEEEGCFNRFMVGDVKQSIYKFRLARPELFLEKYDSYEQDGKCTRIDLSKNFH